MEENIKRNTYETKCRRCGNLITWYFSNYVAFQYPVFMDAINDHIKNPRLMDCKYCDKQTVQELVSCSPLGGE